MHDGSQMTDALLHFANSNCCRYSPYDDPKVFHKTFCQSNHRRGRRGPVFKLTSDGKKRLQVCLGAICLRRRKESQLDGKPIIDLPEVSVDPDSRDARYPLTKSTAGEATDSDGHALMSEFSVSSTEKRTFPHPNPNLGADPKPDRNLQP